MDGQGTSGGGGARMALVLAAFALCGGVLVWWGQGPRSQPPTQADATDAPSADPGAIEADVTGTKPAPPPARATATDSRPAGERLTPGQWPQRPERFVARTRTGGSCTGWALAARTPAAPLLVWVGPSPLERWSSTLQTLRRSRDYHLVGVVVDGAPRPKDAPVEAQRTVEAFEAAAAWAQSRWRPSAVVLIGEAHGGAAAMLLAAERRDVLAAVAISPPARLGRFRLTEALGGLRGRHTRWIGGREDPRSAAVLEAARSLPLAAVDLRPGAAAGAALLAADRRARTNLAGWLFAITPATD